MYSPRVILPVWVVSAVKRNAISLLKDVEIAPESDVVRFGPDHARAGGGTVFAQINLGEIRRAPFRKNLCHRLENCGNGGRASGDRYAE